MNELSPKTVVERFRRAKDRRTTWEAHWRECYDFALPQRGCLQEGSVPGEKRSDRIFDGTAPDAVDQLAASMLAQLTPPWANWFGLTVGAGAAEEDREQLSVELERAELALQSHFDRSNFAVEMMLKPVNITEGRLDPDCLRRYDDGLVFHEGNGETTLSLGASRLVSATCWWDPAYGSPGKGDASVIAAVFTDDEGGYRLHAIRYLEHDPAKSEETDEATQLCRQVASFVEENFLPAVVLETNGLGRFLPGLLRREFAENGLRCAVVEKATRKNKDLRIIDAFDAVLAARRLLAHRSVWDTPFVAEMREWRPGGKIPDDGLDAVAGCLSCEPVRLPRISENTDARPRDLGKWRGSGATYRARTGFSV